MSDLSFGPSVDSLTHTHVHMNICAKPELGVPDVFVRAQIGGGGGVVVIAGDGDVVGGTGDE